MGFKKAAQNLSSPYVSAPLTVSPFVIEREEGTLRLLFTVSPRLPENFTARQPLVHKNQNGAACAAPPPAAHFAGDKMRLPENR